MIGALIIVFREVIEAGIIVGIILAVTSGIAGSRRWVTIGVASGTLGAGLVALFAGAIADALAGIGGQDIFNASILMIAVVMLAWHSIWMARHGREMALEMRAYGQEVRSGARSLPALAIVVAVAVMREGSEVALFMVGLSASTHENPVTLLAGAGLGLLAGIGVSAATFLGLVVIPTRYLFTVTSALITLLAAGLAAQSVVFLQQAGLVDIGSQTAWDTSSLLTEASVPGRILHTLIGYSDQPSVLQVVVYATTLAVIITLSRLFAPGRRPSTIGAGRAA